MSLPFGTLPDSYPLSTCYPNYEDQDRPFRILIYCILLGGMGDISFANTLFNYLKEWTNEENMDIKIALYDQDGEESARKKQKIFGLSDFDVIILSKNRYASSIYGELNPSISCNYFDLYLLAPVTMSLVYDRIERYAFNNETKDEIPAIIEDMEEVSGRLVNGMKSCMTMKNIIVNDLQKQFLNVDMRNTFLFSVYNAEDDANADSDFDFSTGIGPTKCGILLTDADVLPITVLPQNLQNEKFVLIYVNFSGESRRSDPERYEITSRCIADFIKNIADTYTGQTDIHVILQKHVYDELDLQELSCSMEVWEIVEDGRLEKYAIYENGGHKLIFRTDILPVNSLIFKQLIYYSQPEILMTGNQSVTDIISCCTDKKLWYQSDPWTESFGEGLTKYGGAKKCSRYDDGNCVYNDDSTVVVSRLDNIKEYFDFRKISKDKILNIIDEAKERRFKSDFYMLGYLEQRGDFVRTIDMFDSVA
jgi:hypothetical protein